MRRIRPLIYTMTNIICKKKRHYHGDIKATVCTCAINMPLFSVYKNLNRLSQSYKYHKLPKQA